MKIFFVFALICFACILNTESTELGGAGDIVSVDKRSAFDPFDMFGGFVDITCKVSPWKCNDYILGAKEEDKEGEKEGEKGAAADSPASPAGDAAAADAAADPAAAEAPAA